jgi:hypothetical protein
MICHHRSYYNSIITYLQKKRLKDPLITNTTDGNWARVKDEKLLVRQDCTVTCRVPEDIAEARMGIILHFHGVKVQITQVAFNNVRILLY